MGTTGDSPHFLLRRFPGLLFRPPHRVERCVRMLVWFPRTFGASTAPSDDQRADWNAAQTAARRPAQASNRLFRQGTWAPAFPQEWQRSAKAPHGLARQPVGTYLRRVGGVGG